MTDTPAPNDMPEFKVGDYVRKKGDKGQWHGRVCGFYSTECTPHGVAVESVYEKNSVQIYPANALELWDFANPRAPVAAGGEALNWKRQKDTVFAWAAEHGFTPVESEIVDLLSALQQPPAPAVDLNEIKRQTILACAKYSIMTNENAHYIKKAIDHLAAQGMIKGVE